MTDGPMWSEDEVRMLLEGGAHLNVQNIRERITDASVVDMYAAPLAMVLEVFITHWMSVMLKANVDETTGQVVQWSPEYEALMGDAHRGSIACALTILKRWPTHPFGEDSTPIKDVEREVLAVFGIAFTETTDAS